MMRQAGSLKAVNNKLLATKPLDLEVNVALYDSHGRRARTPNDSVKAGLYQSYGELAKIKSKAHAKDTL